MENISIWGQSICIFNSWSVCTVMYYACTNTDTSCMHRYYIHTHAHTYTHILTNTHTHAHTHKHTCTHIHTNAHAYTHMHMSILTCTCVEELLYNILQRQLLFSWVRILIYLLFLFWGQLVTGEPVDCWHYGLSVE